MPQINALASPVLGRVLDRLFQWAAPWECPACGEACSAQDFCICGKLFTPADPEWKFIPMEAGKVFAVQSQWQWTEPARTLFHRLKYGGELFWLKRWVSPRMGEVVVFSADTIIVPVPSRIGAWLKRGFNPAEEIANVVARETDLKLECGILRRTRGAKPQVGKSKAERTENVQGQFLTTNRENLKHPVLLVDDVVTTGATLMECAKVLLAAGAPSVTAWTLFRAGTD